MAIEIIDSPDPLSEASLRRFDAAAEPLLVESSASRILRQELIRYCQGMINGRSFLIAGHRGAGKTTLVAKAFMDVRRESARGVSMLRPLFIPLHGPSLFPNPVARTDAQPKTDGVQKKDDPAKTDAAKKDEPPKRDEAPRKDDPPKKSDAQIALEQITLGLHRAVAREFAAQFRERIDTLSQLRRRPNEELRNLRSTRSNRSYPSDGTDPADAILSDPLPDEAALNALAARLPNEREMFELAAQFESELYEGPTAERLREYWDRAHALSGGVLFREGFAPRVGLGPGAGFPTPPVPAGLFPNLVEVHAQGVRELLALTGVLEAYRRISGDYKRTEGEKSTDARTNERATGISPDTKELAGQVVSLLTGGLTATGLAIAGARPAITALGAIGTALGSALVFKSTTTRKRERTKSREYQFVYDLSVATLDRILPILIERLRAAGLAPVFVVDELDKVNELSARLVTMVHHLKKLVAENAFFCFLTNRSYFEEMLAQGSGRPYPVEYTYYTHRLFVVFSPEDFERYLRKRVPAPAVEPTPEPAPNQSTPVQGLEVTASAMLRWALRHRAQLHAVDLQREIAAVRDDDGKVRTKPEVITSARRNRIDLTFQVGIELTLAQDEVEQVLQDRPEFRRLVHDAIYYLSRRWIEGAEEIDLTDAGYNAFRTYLEERTGRDEERPNGSKPEGARESVNIKDADFLFEQVGNLADFISDRPSFDPTTVRDWRIDRIDEWNHARRSRDLPDVDADLIDVLLVGESGSLLIADPTRKGVYRFRHRVAGRGRQASAAPPAVKPPTATEEPPKRTAPNDEAAAPEKPSPEIVWPERSRASEESAAPSVAASQWLQQAKFIEDFAEALRRATQLDVPEQRGRKPSSPGAITLDSLATTYRIIAPSPTASIALKAIANLRDGTARGLRASNEEDVFQVGQFHAILLRNGEQIARAIMLGALVGRAQRQTELTTDQRIGTGLAVISRGLRFADKRETEVATSLENLTAIATGAHGDMFERAIDSISTSWPNLTVYETTLSAVVKGASELTVRAEPALAHAAWNSTRQRLADWLVTRESSDPNLDELLASTAGVGPSRFLEFDFAQMTLQQWTKALLAAREKERWLTIFVWHALGFCAQTIIELGRFARWAGLPDDFATSAVSNTAWPEEIQRTFRATRDGVLLGRPMPSATAVVLRRSKSPMTDGWRPLDDTATLVLTANELTQLTKPRSSTTTTEVFTLPFTGDRVCAVEMEPEFGYSTLYAEQLPTIKALFANQDTYLVHGYQSDPGREIRQPAVVAPPDLMALINTARRMLVSVPDKPTT